RPMRPGRTIPSTRAHPSAESFAYAAPARRWRRNERRGTTPGRRSRATLRGPHFLPRGLRRATLTAARRDFIAATLRFARLTRVIRLPRLTATLALFALGR